MKSASSSIEHILTSQPRENVRNARTHSRRQINQIASSIREFGFVSPILIDEHDRLIAGHGRLEAARKLALATVPAIRLCDLTEPQKRALALADNKLAENAGWNVQLLAEELEYLTNVEIDFDVSITGFENAETDGLIDGARKADALSEAPIPDLPETSVVDRGDVWLLGHNRLLCGDATDAADIERLMDGRRAQMVFIDPPYNVPIAGHASGLGKKKHRDFIEASGEMSEAQFVDFLTAAFTNLCRQSVDGSIHYVCMDWRHFYEAITAGRHAYDELKNLCVWNKSNGGMGSLYRSKHELVLVFKNGSAQHINNIELGRFGRYRTNVWEYTGASSLGEGRAEALAMHPTVKPLALVADAIQDCSRRNGIILDCFSGSGTTIIAAERTGRRAYAMDLDPRYVETAIRRWQEETGEVARHAETGLTLFEIEARHKIGSTGENQVDLPSTENVETREVTDG